MPHGAPISGVRPFLFLFCSCNVPATLVGSGVCNKQLGRVMLSIHRSAALAAFIFVFSLTVTTAPAQDRRQNQPGQFDFYVLALSWSPSFCEAAEERSPGRAPAEQCGERPYSFVVHGLWPQYEKGFPEYCQQPPPRVDRAAVSSMLDLMPSPRLIFNEWRKHGTCAGFSVGRYFEEIRKARAVVKIPDEYPGSSNRPRSGACRGGGSIPQSQSKSERRRNFGHLRQQTRQRSAGLFVQGAAVSGLLGTGAPQLQTRETRHARGAGWRACDGAVAHDPEKWEPVFG